MSNANAGQVGGTHYATGTGVQHWDYTVQCLNHRYLEGAITKYVSRHRKKNGVEDLKKALHFLQKLREQHSQGLIPPMRPATVKAEQVCQQFCDGADLNVLERKVMLRIMEWDSVWDLDKLDQYVGELYVLQQDADRALQAVKAGANRGPDGKFRHVGLTAGPNVELKSGEEPGPGYVKQDHEE